MGSSGGAKKQELDACIAGCELCQLIIGCDQSNTNKRQALVSSHLIHILKQSSEPSLSLYNLSCSEERRSTLIALNH